MLKAQNTDNVLSEPAQQHMHTYMCTYTLHAVEQGAHPIQFIFPLQMSHTKGQPLAEPAHPWGSSLRRPHLKTEQGK